MRLNPKASTVMNFLSKHQRFWYQQLCGCTLKCPRKKMMYDLIAMRMRNIFFFFLFLTLIFWETERQSESGRGAERDGDTESEAGPRLWAVSTEPHAGLKPRNHEIMTWVKVRRLTDWATQEPISFLNSGGQWASVGGLAFMEYKDQALGKVQTLSPRSASYKSLFSVRH